MPNTISRGSVGIMIVALALSALAPFAYAAVSTDKSDYTPGETVTISGDGYWAGETVSIEVTAPYGSESGLAAADGSGEFSWSFTLPNDESAFGEYTYAATGLESGVEQGGVFTDGNVKAFPAPTATTFTLVKTTYSTTNCTGTPASGPTTVNNVSNPSGNTTGVGNTESVKLRAAAFSNQGGAFIAWTTVQPFVATSTTVVAGDTICIAGFTGGGNRDYFANYGLPPGILVVKKVLINDNGGTAATTTFSFQINGASTTPFNAQGEVVLSLASSTYSITELAAAGYATTYTNSKNANNNCTNLAVTSSATTTCTITNNDSAPSLTLLKVVSGGATVPSDWTLTATGPTGFSGPGPSVASGASFNSGTYDLSESGPAGYTAGDWVCTGGNQTDGDTVEIGLGEEVLCVLTNIFVEPVVPTPTPCKCVLLKETIQSDETNTVVGDGTAIAIVPSPAWTASIPGAAWIWKSGPTAPNETVSFEQAFSVVGTVLSAQLQIASDNSYKIFIDGVQVAADASATNFTLATQDTHDLTADVTSGTHVLRIEVTNVGVFNPVTNPAGLLYRLIVDSEDCNLGSASGGISVVVCNTGVIVNDTFSSSRTGDNAAGGSVGGSGGSGGDIDPAGDYNNGGASAGGGGDGGNARRGGFIQTGIASANASTTNDLNRSDVEVGMPPDTQSSSIGITISNLAIGCDCNNLILNGTRARARTGDNTADGSQGGNGGVGGGVQASDGEYNNGGASAGNGGNGGTGGLGGFVRTGNAVSTANTTNMLNAVFVRVGR